MVFTRPALILFLALGIAFHGYGQNWSEPDKLKNPLSTPYEQYFGTAMDIYGNTMFVTSRSGQIGEVLVYKLDSACSWNQSQRFVSPLNSNHLGNGFGASIDIFGDVAVIGATSLTSKDLQGNDVMGSGAAFVYKRTNHGKWVFEQALAASDLHIYAQFGLSVATNGEYIAVGARNATVKRGSEVYEHAGAVYLFKKDSNGKWVQQKRFIKPEKDRGGGFGQAVLMEGSTLIVGSKSSTYDNNGPSHGLAYLYRPDDMGEWSLRSRVVSPEKGVYSEFSEHGIAMEGNLLAIADPVNDFDANGKAEVENNGAVFLYRIKNDSAEFFQKITTKDPSMGARFGTSLSLSNGQLAIGSPSNTVNNLTSGSAHIFETDENGLWKETQRLLPKDRVWKDGMGFRLKQSAGHLIVAAPYAANNGKMYVYTHSDTTLFVRANGGVLSSSMAGSRYQWIDCHTKQPVPGATSRCFQPKTHGSYAVQVLVGKAFVTSECEGVWPLSTDHSQKIESSVQVYPNPVNTTLFVRQSGNVSQETQLSLIGLNGRVWHQQRFSAPTTQVSVAHLPTGIYILQVLNGQTNTYQKVIVER